MPRRNDERKEGHGEPRGVRLTTRTDSEGAKPKDGARMEKAWQVTEVGAKRSDRSKRLKLGAKHATSKGRRLNKPLSTGSKRTLDVERVAASPSKGELANSGTANLEALGNKAADMQPSKGEKTSGRDAAWRSRLRTEA